MVLIALDRRYRFPDPGQALSPVNTRFVQGALPGFPIGCRVDLPQARQGEDNVVWIKSGTYGRPPASAAASTLPAPPRSENTFPQTAQSQGWLRTRIAWASPCLVMGVLSEAGHPFAQRVAWFTFGQQLVGGADELPDLVPVHLQHQALPCGEVPVQRRVGDAPRAWRWR